ncbi:hypothetical protein ACQ4LE_000225 [Meloidogyne hapla]|uniref:Transmembrane protein 230 n=1 Tax=Meloidogyne hapla TaxID=6305 RepID=A0A1I8BSI7_MELHA
MATVPYFASNRHQRSHSQLQQLIPLSSSNRQPNTSSTTWPPIQLKQQNLNKEEKDIRLSTLGSECSSSSYYRLPGISHQDNRGTDQRRGGISGRCLQMLEDNLKLLIGSLALSVFGTALILFSFCITFLPNDMDIHGWIFLVVGILFAIPGFYHLIYICCALFGRPGYSFEQLPTINKNTKFLIN